MPGGYLAASFISTFLGGLLAYLGFGLYAIPVFVIAWLIIPVLWLNDRISFDGRRIRRTGLVNLIFTRLTGTRDCLKINDIEQIETAVFAGIKRGRNVQYTYRTAISGKTARFVFSSRYRGYRELVRTVFPLVDEDILDNSSIDLRDYLAEDREVAAKARESEIPATDVLDSSFREISLRTRIRTEMGADDTAFEKAAQLRRLANELRLSGLLLQALEAFRRAAVLRPRDARLLFEFAECIRSVAGSERDQRLERKALAMMRLAERHAGNDDDLLSRIGESYFQVGEWRRAAAVFRRVADLFGENFRILRGMAELSLREGKLAHVIHNFAAAEQIASTSALRRWTRSEVAYFSHLNEDEEYMELEISRINLLDTLERTRSSSVRISLLGFLAIGLGLVLDDSLVANIGWAVSGLSLLVWISAILLTRMLSPRIPFELMENDE